MKEGGVDVSIHTMTLGLVWSPMSDDYMDQLTSLLIIVELLKKIPMFFLGTDPGGGPGPPWVQNFFFLVIIFFIFVVRPPSKTLGPLSPQ